MSLAGFAFAGGGFDRAASLRGDAAALDRLWPQARVLRVDTEARALDTGELDAWPNGGALRAERPADACFLGLVDGRACFALEQAAEGAPTTDLRSAGMAWPAREASLLATAGALTQWLRRNRHCGGCGSAVERRQGGWSLRCPGCGLEAYPRTDPAIIVAVSSGSRLLMGRQARWPPGRWSVIAGFVEPGETLSQAVVREVAEETGVSVDRVHYAGDQPWPFPFGLMLGFFAEAAPGAGDPVLDDELEAARWVDRDEVGRALGALPGERDPAFSLPPRLSIARALIEAWYAGR